MPHASQLHYSSADVPRILARLPRRVVRRVSEALVILSGLAILFPWIGLVIAGLLDNSFVPDHLSTVKHLFTLLTISATGSLLTGLTGMFLARTERPLH